MNFCYLKVIQGRVGEERGVSEKNNTRDEFGQSTLYACVEISK
jgi:hypothetical protein